MPVGTPFHARTFARAESLNYREWSGYYAVSAYEAHHEHEYNAIRNAAALIDVSPLYKYMVEGRDAARLVDRVITRDATKMAVGQVVYTPWCAEDGRVIDDGTVSRLAEQRFRWTAADPSLRWLRMNARGLDVTVEDVSEDIAALAVQGPNAGALVAEVTDGDVETLKYFRVTSGSIAGIPVDISRTGYTGDLGYELWMPAAAALAVWDTLVDAGRRYGAQPAGMLALDVARIEAGLLLTDVDFFSCRKALIESHTYTPFEMGLDRLVAADKAPYVGQAAHRRDRQHGAARRIVGLDLDWPTYEALHTAAGLPPQVPAAASRVAVPIYGERGQVGRATSTTWSPTLKKLIALATVSKEVSRAGALVDIEVTVDAVRHRIPARVVDTPFFNPPRKMKPIGRN